VQTEFVNCIIACLLRKRYEYRKRVVVLALNNDGLLLEDMKRLNQMLRFISTCAQDRGKHDEERHSRLS